jgi:hypothetical protein
MPMTESRRRILGLTLREHIGGRWAISWVLFVFNIPFNLLSITTNISQVPGENQWLGWVLVAIAGLITIGVFFLIGDFILFRSRRVAPVPIAAVIGFGFVTGAARGVVVVLVADALNLQPVTLGGLLNRVVAGAVLGAAVMPLGALALSVVSRYRAERQHLLDERAEIERRRLAEQDEVRVLRAAVVDDVRQEVLDVARTVIQDGGGPQEVPAALRRTSHSLWAEPSFDSQVSESPIRVSSVIWRQVSTRKLPVLWICVLWGLSATGTVIGFNGLLLGGLQVAFGVFSLAVCLAIANRWIASKPQDWAWATGTFVGLGWIFTSPISYALFDNRPLETALPVMVLNLFWLPIIVALMTIAASAVSSGEEVLERLRGSIDAADVTTRALEVERDQILRELAEQLHGSVHSPLVTRFALAVDERSIHDQVGEAVASLGRLTVDVPLQERLLELATSWDGLVDIEVEVSGGNAHGRDVERVVKEAIANAYRHGHATSISVRIRDAAGSVEVFVEDDGVGLSPTVSPGLGSRLFDTLGEWAIDRVGNKTVVRMRLD